MGDLCNPLPLSTGECERQGHGTGQVRDSLMRFSIQPIKEALDAERQTRLKLSDEGRFKSLNPILIIKQISARASRHTRRPESQEHRSRFEHVRDCHK